MMGNLMPHDRNLVQILRYKETVNNHSIILDMRLTSAILTRVH